MMTRQHFVLIAAVIHDLPSRYRRSVAAHFAVALRRTNSQFDEARFIAACTPLPAMTRTHVEYTLIDDPRSRSVNIARMGRKLMTAQAAERALSKSHGRRAIVSSVGPVV